MRKVVAASLPQTSAEITFAEGYPPMAPTEGNRKLLSLYDAVSRDLGFGPVTAVNPRNAGAADISFAADHVEMAIDGLGLLGAAPTRRKSSPTCARTRFRRSGWRCCCIGWKKALNVSGSKQPFER